MFKYVSDHSWCQQSATVVTQQVLQTVATVGITARCADNACGMTPKSLSTALVNSESGPNRSLIFLLQESAFVKKKWLPWTKSPTDSLENSPGIQHNVLAAI